MTSKEIRTIALMAAMAAGLGGCGDGAEPVPGASEAATAAVPAGAAATAAPAEGSTAAAASPTSAQSPAHVFPDQFQALGTEPFWSLAVDGTTARYSMPDDSGGQTAAIVRSVTGGTLTASGNLGATSLRLTLRQDTCSDGMSDTSYPYTANLTVGTRELSGCAREGLPRDSSP